MDRPQARCRHRAVGAGPSASLPRCNSFLSDGVPIGSEERAAAPRRLRLPAAPGWTRAGRPRAPRPSGDRPPPRRAKGRPAPPRRAPGDEGGAADEQDAGEVGGGEAGLPHRLRRGLQRALHELAPVGREVVAVEDEVEVLRAPAAEGVREVVARLERGGERPLHQLALALHAVPEDHVPAHLHAVDAVYPALHELGEGEAQVVPAQAIIATGGEDAQLRVGALDHRRVESAPAEVVDQHRPSVSRRGPDSARHGARAGLGEDANHLEAGHAPAAHHGVAHPLPGRHRHREHRLGDAAAEARLGPLAQVAEDEGCYLAGGVGAGAHLHGGLVGPLRLDAEGRARVEDPGRPGVGRPPDQPLDVRNERRHEVEVARAGLGDELEALAPAHPRPSTHDIDDALQLAVMVRARLRVRVDGDRARPELLGTRPRAVDRRRAIHPRRLRRVRVEVAAADDPHTVVTPAARSRFVAQVEGVSGRSDRGRARRGREWLPGGPSTMMARP